MPKYNVRISYMPGFKDCIWADNEKVAFDKFLDKYKLDNNISYITTVQEVFHMKGEFDE